MYTVKLTFNYDWPFFRQTPRCLGVWGNYKFIIDPNLQKCDFWVVFTEYGLVRETCICNPQNIIFLPLESFATSIRYPQEFLRQFGKIITVQKEIQGDNVIYYQNAPPWFVEKSYDELINQSNPIKTKLLSIICSDKTFTDGHRKRLEFTKRIKSHFGDDIDFFGRGINSFESKWETLASYKFHIAIENNFCDDYFTEKIIDPILAGSYPFYYGCPNLEKYIPKDAFTRIDISDFEQTISVIEYVINNNQIYNEYLRNINFYKKLIINNLQFFPMICQFLDKLQIENAKLITIYGVDKCDASKFKLIDNRMNNIYLRSKNTILNTGKRILKLFSRIKDSCQNISNEEIQTLRCAPWFEVNGDETLRLDYPLDEKSLVFDVGGYKGDFAMQIYNKYNCKIYIFEPVPEFNQYMKNRFFKLTNVELYNFGLSNSTRKEFISKLADGSSIFTNSSEKVEIQLKSIIDFMNEKKLNKVDLIKINIEGGEYDLLESLIEGNYIDKFNNLQIQFHDFILPNAKERMLKIQRKLMKTHCLTYKYEFVWENWKKK